jgi:DNA polymerase-1
MDKQYKPIYTLAELQTYLSGATHVAFDFETAPLDKYRSDRSAALDAHRAVIVGISFSVAEGSAVYLPLAHRVGENAAEQEAVWDYLAGLFTNPNVCKIAHNLAFESQFLYARGIIIQEPCYDSIAASQCTYKGEREFRRLDESGLKLLHD